MALSDANGDLLLLSNGSLSPSVTTTASGPEASASLSSTERGDVSVVSTPRTQQRQRHQPRPTPPHKEPQQRSRVSQDGGAVKQNGSLRAPSSSTSSSHLTDSQRLAKLLPSALSTTSSPSPPQPPPLSPPPPCCHRCPFHPPLCCHGNQQECHIFQTHAPALQLHPGSCSCCLQASPPSLCLHHRWQEHLQNQPNVAGLRYVCDDCVFVCLFVLRSAMGWPQAYLYYPASPTEALSLRFLAEWVLTECLLTYHSI